MIASTRRSAALGVLGYVLAGCFLFHDGPTGPVDNVHERWSQPQTRFARTIPVVLGDLVIFAANNQLIARSLETGEAIGASTSHEGAACHGDSRDLQDFHRNVDAGRQGVQGSRIAQLAERLPMRKRGALGFSIDGWRHLPGLAECLEHHERWSAPYFALVMQSAQR